MIIEQDERTILRAGKNISLCVDCETEKVGRHVKVDGMLKTERGYYFICFECLKPRVFWRKNLGGRLFNSPA